MRPAWFLPLVLVAPSGQAALVVGGFASNLPGSQGDDAWEVWNQGAATESLDDVTFTDGEGRVTLPSGATLAPGARTRVALNASAYREAARSDADWATDAADPTRRLVELETGLLLAKDGDQFRMERGANVLDAVAWGDVADPGPGWTGPPLDASSELLRWHRRATPEDTDSLADWDRPQRPRLGWLEAAPAAFPVEGPVLGYTAPDQSRAVLLGVLESATSHLRINVYEFRDVGVAQRLLAHMESHPNLRVDVLVDASPVGLDAEERAVRNRILAELSSAGATVRLMRHDRYNYDHAKYVIADDQRVLVQSENFVPSALPADARTGNRGWGVVADDAALAGELARVFDYDFALDAYGARAIGPDEAGAPPLPAVAMDDPRPRLATATASGARVTLLAGPESNLVASDAVLTALRQAQSQVLVEQLEFPPIWRDASGRDWPNEYFDALLDAHERGVEVRVLLDGHFLDGSNDNADAADRLAQQGIQVRLQTRPDVGVLHVKGLVVDGRYALVGSMNWNLNSVAQNREVDLLVDAAELAALYRDAFEIDWDEAAPGEPSDLLPAGPAIATIIMSLVLARRLRRGGA